MAERIPAGEFRLIEGAGHWPQWEQQERFDQLVLEFLGNVVEAAAERLESAARSGVACAPVADLLGPDDIDSAYHTGVDVQIGRHARVRQAL